MKEVSIITSSSENFGSGDFSELYRISETVERDIMRYERILDAEEETNEN